MHHVVPTAAIYRYVCACVLHSSAHLKEIFNNISLTVYLVHVTTRIQRIEYIYVNNYM